MVDGDGKRIESGGRDIPSQALPLYPRLPFLFVLVTL
jgi:hypothetical protein